MKTDIFRSKIYYMNICSVIIENSCVFKIGRIARIKDVPYRMLGDMIMNRKGKGYMMFITFLVLGTIITVQIRSTIDNRKSSAQKVLKVEKLIEQLEMQKNKYRELEDLIKIESDKADKLVLDYAQQHDNIPLREQYYERKTEMLKGCLIDVKGPGLIIKLDDAIARKDEIPNSLLIHDVDIKEILNELKIAGAQAISINGERIVATSEQVCAGPTIRINKNRYSVPYIIKVIGDPDKLNRAVNNSQRIAFLLRDKIRVEVKTSNNVFIPALKTGEKGLDAFINKLEVVK